MSHRGCLRARLRGLGFILRVPERDEGFSAGEQWGQNCTLEVSSWLWCGRQIGGGEPGEADHCEGPGRGAGRRGLPEQQSLGLIPGGVRK